MFTQEVADKICLAIANGVGLKTFLRETKGMPCWWTVYQWIKSRPEFAAAMEEARKLGARAIAEEALEIADTPMLGEEVTINEDGTRTVKTGDMLGHRKLQIETRLKLLAKWHPKEYGDKVDLNHSGRIGVAKELSEEELASIAAGGGG
jgi:hypothetical protein